MEYLEFERILSAKRIQRYKDAANGDTRKARALYRYNLRLSQEMFTIVSCFEVALRNAIDGLLVTTLGENWLKDSVQDNGIFSNGRMNETRKISAITTAATAGIHQKFTQAAGTVCPATRWLYSEPEICEPSSMPIP